MELVIQIAAGIVLAVIILRAVEGRRARGRVARDPGAAALDERFFPLANYVLAGNHYECAWEPFRFGHFNGLTHEAAAHKLCFWARRQQINVKFEVRRVGTQDVIFVLLLARGF